MPPELDTPLPRRTRGEALERAMATHPAPEDGAETLLHAVFCAPEGPAEAAAGVEPSHAREPAERRTER